MTPNQRTIITPEGIPLTFTLASRTARIGALLLDLLLVAVLLLAAAGALMLTAGQMRGPAAHQALQALFILWSAVSFLLRYGWFLAFELSPRGATPGKRALGLRIAARDGARLTTDMVIARNLLRDIEIVLPIAGVFAALGSDSSNLVTWVAAAWFLLFAAIPLLNRDRLRAGDLIAGTWVVEAPRRKLEAPLSTVAPEYAFAPADLAAYGEFELHTLERVLRDGQDAALQAVALSICRKIGWTPPQGPETRRFLDAYYQALRARLEEALRFGQRKADKFTDLGDAP